MIEIDDTKNIGDIISLFSERYPFLKVEFYNQVHGWQQESSGKKILAHDKTIGEVRTKHNPGVVEIYSWHKTGAVEQEFRNRFGLNVQIFRHQGDTWIQTVGTDELTLDEQNEIGRKATIDYLHIAGHSKTERNNIR
jgi:hypothetical protein